MLKRLPWLHILDNEAVNRSGSIKSTSNVYEAMCLSQLLAHDQLLTAYQQ